MNARYGSTEAQNRYRLKFFDEETGAEVQSFYNVHVKMAVDGCTRRSCGAAAPGGDVHITNFVLSVADFPMTTGRTDHSFVAASVNAGESAIWPKLDLFLWAQQVGFVDVTLKQRNVNLEQSLLNISKILWGKYESRPTKNSILALPSPKKVLPQLKKNTNLNSVAMTIHSSIFLNIVNLQVPLQREHLRRSVCNLHFFKN